MKKILLAYGILLLFQNCQGQPKMIERNDSLRKIYQEKLNKYLAKAEAIKDFVQISDTGIALYESPEAKAKNEFEYSFNWLNIKRLNILFKSQFLKLQTAYEAGDLLQVLNDSSLLAKNEKADLPPTPSKVGEGDLKGWKIALDPGHFAGDLETAKAEGKLIEMKLADNQKISFFESELAWYTARILQLKLEKLGAEVLLTRDKFSHTALGTPYMEWYKNYVEEQKKAENPVPNLTPQSAFTRKFFRMELNERSRKINEFQPNLTLVIHYNVESNNIGWAKPVKTNYSMAFVGGAFQKNELNPKENRFQFLRLLVSDDLSNSMQFSQIMLEKIKENLKIPITPAQNDQKFLDDTSILTSSLGVYARNLTLTRQVNGTICYIEPLFQDNEIECKLLNTRDLEFEGRKIPKRVQEVAEVYLKAILAYTKKNKP